MALFQPPFAEREAAPLSIGPVSFEEFRAKVIAAAEAEAPRRYEVYCGLFRQLGPIFREPPATNGRS